MFLEHALSALKFYQLCHHVVVDASKRPISYCWRFRTVSCWYLRWNWFGILVIRWSRFIFWIGAYFIQSSIAKAFDAIGLTSLFFSTTASSVPLQVIRFQLLQPSPKLPFLIQTEQPLFLQHQPNKLLLVFPCNIAKQAHFWNGWVDGEELHVELQGPHRGWVMLVQHWKRESTLCFCQIDTKLWTFSQNCLSQASHGEQTEQPCFFSISQTSCCSFYPATLPSRSISGMVGWMVRTFM